MPGSHALPKLATLSLLVAPPSTLHLFLAPPSPPSISLSLSSKPPPRSLPLKSASRTSLSLSLSLSLSSPPSSSSSSCSMRPQEEEEKFADYFEKWVCRLEEYSHQLHSASRDASMTEQELRALVSKLTAHHKEYYTAKWAAATSSGGGGGDVFAFFSPPWSTPLENAYSWLTGWKPSAAFGVVEALRARGAAMAEDQVKRIEQLRARIKLEEERVEREMERQQVAVADRRMVELARLEGQRGDAAAAAAAGPQVDGLVGAAVKGLASGLGRIMKAADCVRLKTLKGLLDELSPPQCVEFLAAMSALQVQLRRWGKKRQSQAEEKSSEAC